MNIQIVHKLPADVWDSFVINHPLGNIFHTREMFEVWTRTKNYQPKLCAATDNGKILALLLPVQITLGNELLQPFTTRAVVYGSALWDQGMEGKQALTHLLHTYWCETGGHPLFTEFRNISDLSDIQSTLQECGYKFEEHLNCLINLDQSKEDIWKGFSKSIQKHVSTAEKKKLIIQKVTNRSQITDIYNLLKQTYRRLVAIPLPDQTYFKAAFDILMPMGMLNIYLAQVDDTYISTRLFLIYKDRIIDWHTGSDRSFANFFPEELAIWHILQWGKANDYCLFDFGGAGKPGEYYGPRIFKQRFGGTLVNYGRNTLVHSPARFNISKFIYKIVRSYNKIGYTT